MWHTIPRRERPVLVYTHHSAIDLERGRALCAVYNRMHGALVRAADHVVVSSPSYRVLLERAGARRVTVLPHGLTTLADGSWHERRGPFTVAFIGQLRPYKGVDVLLQAAAMLPDVRFEIGGDGHRGPMLHELARRLGLHNVRWHGVISDSARDELFRRSHAVVLPSTSRAEAFGIVLLEGMAYGAVPVASDLPGVRDVCGTHGLLCRPGDPRSLAQALCYLRDDPGEWERRSRRAVQVASTYRWDDTVLGYHSILVHHVAKRTGIVSPEAPHPSRVLRGIPEAARPAAAPVTLSLVEPPSVHGLALRDDDAVSTASQ
jgi:rhamnosyl/mannosyltransferase